MYFLCNIESRYPSLYNKISFYQKTIISVQLSIYRATSACRVYDECNALHVHFLNVSLSINLPCNSHMCIFCHCCLCLACVLFSTWSSWSLECIYSTRDKMLSRFNYTGRPNYTSCFHWVIKLRSAIILYLCISHTSKNVS